MNAITKATVKNLADYAEDKAYIVARFSGSELWFWGAWDNEDTARKTAAAIGGVVIKNMDKE